MHRPGDLPPAVSCTRLFACVNWTKAQISIKYEINRKRHFQVLSSLMHIEKKIKQYSRCVLTQGSASPWRLAIRCELHASVCICVEDQGAQFVTITRSFSVTFSSLVHIEKKIKQDSRCDLTQGYASLWRLAIRCELHASVCMCVEDQGAN